MIAHSWLHSGPTLSLISPAVIALVNEEHYAPKIEDMSDFDLAEEMLGVSNENITQNVTLFISGNNYKSYP